MTIHWFSDFIAGAIFGSVVAVVVGESSSHLPAHLGQLDAQSQTSESARAHQSH